MKVVITPEEEQDLELKVFSEIEDETETSLNRTLPGLTISNHPYAAGTTLRLIDTNKFLALVTDYIRKWIMS